MEHFSHSSYGGLSTIRLERKGSIYEGTIYEGTIYDTLRYGGLSTISPTISSKETNYKFEITKNLATVHMGVYLRFHQL